MTAILLAHWKNALLIVAALSVWGSFAAWGAARKNAGVWQERSRVADSALAAERPKMARVDTLVVRDTVRVRRTVERVDSLRDTLLVHLTDTVLVKEFVRAADSTVQACTELSRDCAAYRLHAAATIAALEQKVRAQPIAVQRSCAAQSVIAGIAGAVIDHVIRR